MVSLEKKFLFIHIPKTAGNSVQNVLKKYSEDIIVSDKEHQDGIERFEIKNDKYNIEKHSTLTDYKETLESHVYGSLFKFSIIRNPWDRMISYYFSPHRGVNDWNRNNFISLLKRVKTAEEYLVEYGLWAKTLNYFGFNISSSGQSKLSNINFLLKFENLSEDFKKLCKKVEIPYEPLPKRNSSKRKHYSYFYDDELKNIVRSKFKKEIEWGSYTFEELS